MPKPTKKKATRTPQDLRRKRQEYIDRRIESELTPDTYEKMNYLIYQRTHREYHEMVSNLYKNSPNEVISFVPNALESSGSFQMMMSPTNRKKLGKNDFILHNDDDYSPYRGPVRHEWRLDPNLLSDNDLNLENTKIFNAFQKQMKNNGRIREEVEILIAYVNKLRDEKEALFNKLKNLELYRM